MTQDTVQEIEANISKLKQFVDLELALERLEKNADFKKVISEGYLKDEAIRLVHAKADPHLQSPDKQAGVVGQIDAIGRLVTYFRGITQNANLARKSIEADEETRDEILAQEQAQ